MDFFSKTLCADTSLWWLIGSLESNFVYGANKNFQSALVDEFPPHRIYFWIAPFDGTRGDIILLFAPFTRGIRNCPILNVFI